MNHDRIAIAGTIRTPIGEVFIAPNGTAFATWRIGEMRNGVVVSDPVLTADEIRRAGLTDAPPETQSSSLVPHST